MHATIIPDWLDFPEVDKPYVEQIYDRREPKVSPTWRRGQVQIRIGATIDRWATGRGAVGTEVRCYLISGEERPSSLVPDIAYYSFARLSLELAEDERERPRIAPDIAVEILSPTDRRASPQKKIELCLRDGAVVVVVVDPENHTIAFHWNDRTEIIEARGRVSLQPYENLELDFDEIFRGR